MTGTQRARSGIKEVARVAGVSVTTVSHALNGKGRLTGETREHVRKVAADLGYRPSNTARNLVSRRTGLLAFVLSPTAGVTKGIRDFEYFTQLMLGATTTALELGYALVLTPPDHGLDSELKVDGAIVVDPARGDPLLKRMRANKVPVVSTGRDLDAPDFRYWVDNDHVSGARSVLDHLQRQGAERIALLTSPADISYTHDTEQAYCDWCEAHGVEVEIRRARGAPTESEGFARATELLNLPEPPDAMYATYGRLAFGAAVAADALNVGVPDELKLVMTATESATANTSPVPLTAINLNPDQIGRRAAELLVALVEDTDAKPPAPIPTRLVARTSTRRGAAVDPKGA